MADCMVIWESLTHSDSHIGHSHYLAGTSVVPTPTEALCDQFLSCHPKQSQMNLSAHTLWTIKHPTPPYRPLPTCFQRSLAADTHSIYFFL